MHIIHVHARQVAEAVRMHQELDSDSLSLVRRKAHYRVDPGLCIRQLMENRLQDVAVSIRNISILPLGNNSDALGAVPVPEAQRGVSRDRPELFAEGTVPDGFGPR